MSRPTTACSKTAQLCQLASPQWAAVMEAAQSRVGIMPLWVGRTKSPKQRECPPLPARTHTPAILPQAVNLCSAHYLFVRFICTSLVICTTDHCQIATNDLGLGVVVQCQNVVRAAGIIIRRRLSVLFALCLHNQFFIRMLHLVGISQKKLKSCTMLALMAISSCS